MKISQKEQLLKMFRDNDNVLTLGQIMDTDHACEYRKNISLLRKDNYEITCTINAKVPSENIYMLIESKTETVKEELKATAKPCTKCGSYYRRGNVCNICGKEQVT